jgi:hypothetical protein
MSRPERVCDPPLAHAFLVGSLSEVVGLLGIVESTCMPMGSRLKRQAGKQAGVGGGGGGPPAAAPSPAVPGAQHRSPSGMSPAGLLPPGPFPGLSGGGSMGAKESKRERY